MTNLIRSLAVLGIALALLHGGQAHAQASRTWVSGVGDDANPCSRTAPCKTFAGAVSKTAPAGEINCLDSAGFGAVTITRALTIACEGVIGSVLVSGTNGIVVQAGPNDRVILRGIEINGIGTGLNGIRFLSGSSLLVENCTIYDFTNLGIDMNLTGQTGDLFVRNTSIKDSGGGIRVAVSGAFLSSTVKDVYFTRIGNNALEVATGNASMNVDNALIARTSSTGASNAVVASASGALINLNNSMLVNNTNAVHASTSGALIRLNNNALYNNTNGIVIAAGATVASANNNKLAGNGPSAAPNANITVQ